MCSLRAGDQAHPTPGVDPSTPPGGGTGRHCPSDCACRAIQKRKRDAARRESEKFRGGVIYLRRELSKLGWKP